MTMQNDNRFQPGQLLIEQNDMSPETVVMFLNYVYQLDCAEVLVDSQIDLVYLSWLHEIPSLIL